MRIVTSVFLTAAWFVMPISSVHPADGDVLVIDADDGATLQAAMDRHADQGARLRLHPSTTLTCTVQELPVQGEVSRHALLIPAGVHLDLNGSTLLLDLRQNSHGVRLSNRSGISNGTIRIIRSEHKGGQAIWHSGISVGAPYDDGGTPDHPGHFSRVADWVIEDMTIDQPFPAAAIQLMSEACHGVIRRVQVLDSPKALMGIGMDWGSVGKANTADDQIPRMRQLWETNQLYTTHPHDILIEDVRIGRLTRNVDGNDAGIRCSACYNIQIRDVHVAAAATAVAVFGGDCGFEFAPEKLRRMAHRGYRIDRVVIDQAFRYGVILNGLADNVYRSGRNHDYQPQIDPALPGLNQLIVRDCQLNGTRSPHSRGLFIMAGSDLQVHNVVVQAFETGVRVSDWVDRLHFRNCNLSGNEEARSISGSQQSPKNVVFE